MTEITHFLSTADEAFERLLLTNTDVQRAYAYADAAHSADNQVRKWTNRPYIEHPRMVASILLHVFPVDLSDEQVCAIQAALLHDVIEDTCCTAEDLLRHFDPEVIDLVEQLSEPDDPLHWQTLGFEGRPNRQTRRALEADRRSTISALGQTISVADIIANSHDILAHAPHDFALLYQSELTDRLAKMDRADPALTAVARTLLHENLTSLREANVDA
jgi:(p)ppGpp synthase/HD superfamily hydrolase